MALFLSKNNIFYQVIATHTESVDADMEVGEEGREGEDVEMRMEHIWKEIKGVELKDARGLIKVRISVTRWSRDAEVRVCS